MADNTMSDSLILEEIQNLKVADLRKRLKSLGLPITGNKTELAMRLQEACLSNKGNDSLESSQLSFDASQIIELGSPEESEAMEDSALLDQDQDQFSSYISTSLDDDPKVMDSIESSLNSVSNSVIMPPKKRTLVRSDSVEKVAEKKVTLNRTNVINIDFGTKQKTEESKPVTVSTNNNSNSEGKVMLSVKTMSAAERLAMRAKRFNVSSVGSNTDSVKALSNRNSKQSIISSSTTPDLEVLKKRAERFGQNVSTVMKQIEEKEKLLKRKCKFGANLSAPAIAGLDEQAKKKKRAERFAL